jgi:23S rRNA (guanosine2251-2'-O)-methyltransferase
MLIIGRNPVIEALRFNPLSVKKIMVMESSSDARIKEIKQTALKHNILIESKSRHEFEKYFDKKNKSEGISQGIAAEVSDFEYADINELFESLNSRSDSIIILLDEIQDPHNLGAIIRTSAAANADAVIISEKNSAKVNHTVIKSSSGAVNYIKIAKTSNIYKTISFLKDRDFRILGTSLKAGQMHFDFDFSGRVALLFGNEGEGLRKNLLKLCDHLIRIPINSNVESLNVSVSAGIILYEALRQRKG